MKRKDQEKLMAKAMVLLKQKGQKAFNTAKKAILQDENGKDPVIDAISYFMDNWRDVYHPALLSLACEAVGGDPNITTHIGAATVLLASAADIHDDIIDQSKAKSKKLTVYGKFGKETALLAGDFLLLKGTAILYEAAQAISQRQRQVINDLIVGAVLEATSAELREAALKGNLNVTPEEYFSIIEMKAVIGKASMQVGAILGGGTPREIEALGNCGRILGILMKIRDDYIDIFEPDELENRFKNECMPLPILYAFQNSKAKSKIMSILGRTHLSEDDAYKVVEIVVATAEFKALKKRIASLVEEGTNSIKLFKDSSICNLAFVLRAVTEDL